VAHLRGRTIVGAEYFSKLKEYDSLGKMKNSYLKVAKEQQERLGKLDLKRQEQLEEIANLKNEHSKLQQAYFEAEKKMNTCEEQASRLRDLGGDQEKISKFKVEAAVLENSLFEMIDRTEEIQKTIDEKKTFLAGLEKTYLEISDEVSSEILENQKNIDQASLRIKLIEEELPTDFRNVLERTLKKNLAIGSFTRVDNGSCFFCRAKISRTEESEIDMQKQLKVCNQCSRIFLPYGN